MTEQHVLRKRSCESPWRTGSVIINHRILDLSKNGSRVQLSGLPQEGLCALHTEITIATRATTRSKDVHTDVPNTLKLCQKVTIHRVHHVVLWSVSYTDQCISSLSQHFLYKRGDAALSISLSSLSPSPPEDMLTGRGIDAPLQQTLVCRFSTWPEGQSKRERIK